MIKLVFTHGKEIEEFDLEGGEIPGEIQFRAVSATVESHNLEFPEDPWSFEVVGDQE